MKAVSDIQGTQREISELLADPCGDERQDREQMEFLRSALQSEHCVFVETLAGVDTLDAYNKVLDTGCRYLTLYPADEDGVHYQMAIAMLQLDLDQPCLDFMLWWSMNEGFQKDTEIWQDPTKMHMSGMKADIFERLPFNDVAHHHPIFLSIAILIKLKLAIDLKNIYLTWRLLESSKLPSELSRLIMKQIPRSALSERFLYINLHVVRTAMQELSKQASQLGQVLHRVDSNLSVALLRNRNMIKSLRRRKKQSQGNTGNEYADRMAEEYSNVSMVYCAFQQTDEVFQILRMADKLCSERSMLVSNEDPWAASLKYSTQCCCWTSDGLQRHCWKCNTR
jgi:hypothetical protein